MSKILVFGRNFCKGGEKDYIEVLSIMIQGAESNLFNSKPDANAIRTLSATLAQRHQVLPLRVVGQTLYLAIADPSNILALDEVRLATGYNIQPVILDSAHIAAEITNQYGALDNIARQVDESLVEGEENLLLTAQNTTPLSTTDIIDSLLEQAVQQRASDIHLEPTRKGGRVRFRIDGILHSQINFDSKVFTAVVTSLKVQAGMDIAQRLTPQDGRLEFSCLDEEIDVRVACLPTIKGEKLVLRLLNRTNQIISIEKLGLTVHVQESLRRFLARSSGMILITGPTGCGKTTTLYTLLRLLNTTEQNIITIEDPVEYHIPGINQVHVNVKAGMSFANGLRAILRQDPNIIMVGEIRDRETAEIAIRAALTGHLVLSTLHTNDAASTIARLLDMGIEPYLLASALSGVMSQRLVRCVCPHCSQWYTPNVQEQALLNRYQMSSIRLKKGSGCPLCRYTGYQGRTAVAEILDPTSTNIHKSILERRIAEDIRQLAIKEGMVSLLADGLSKVIDGQTTVTEVVRAVGWLAE